MAGNRVMKNIWRNDATSGNSKGECFPVKTVSARLTSRGMVARVIRLLTAISETERATFPLNSTVTNPDVVPPGQAARMMNPTLIVGGRSVNPIIRKTIRGSRIICDTRPRIKAFGDRYIFCRSLRLIDSPTPNMMVASTALTRKSI